MRQVFHFGERLEDVFALLLGDTATGVADDEYFAIIKAEIEDFVDKVYNSIREFGYNLKTTPIVFVGGGAVVMKNFGSHDAKNISYNLDVKANARGYEQLATMGLKSTKRLS